MNSINKKILSLTMILLVSFTSFSHALVKPLRYYSDTEATAIFMGELEHEINSVEKQKISVLVRSWKNLYENRINANQGEPSVKEVQAMKELIKKLDEYTIKYYFDNNYENAFININYINYVVENLKTTLTTVDYERLYILCEKYERDYSISDDQVQKIVDEVKVILNKYYKLNADELLDYILNGSENLLAVYTIDEGNLNYEEIPHVTLNTKDHRIKGKYTDIWNEILSIIPYEYFNGFDNLMITSDGELNNLGYVIANDSMGSRWSMSVDPDDVADKELFYETIIHEYFHYVTLNETQVSYSKNPNIYTYYDYEVVTNLDSYLNVFSMSFWDLLRFENQNTVDRYLFYLRHESDFVTSYAATDPAEDICETFISFVMTDKPVDNSVTSQKINFFYEYPELVNLREIIKNNIDNIRIEYEKGA